MTAVKQPEGYDLRLYKAISADAKLEIWVRIAFLGFAGLSSGYAFDDNAFLAITALYLLSQAVFLIVLRQSPEFVSPVRAGLVFTMGFLVMSTIMAAAIYCWFGYPGLGHVLAIMLIFAAMLNSIGLRIREPVASRVEVVTISTAMIVLEFGIFWHGAVDDLQMYMLASAVAGCLVYYLIAFFSVRRAHLALHRKQKQELQSERLKAIGQITGGVAHDFNNLLAIIRGNLELRKELLGNGATSDEVDELLQEVEKATDRAIETTRDLLSYTRRVPIAAEHVDVAALINGLLPILRRAVPANVDIDFAVPSDPPVVAADPRELENVLLNLVINARDALDGQGGQIVMGIVPGPEGTIGIFVRDTGVGMAPDVLAHATEPYFSTKPQGKGSGMGLAMAHGFAKQNAGDLHLESALGRGTVVTLHLPAAVPV